LAHWLVSEDQREDVLYDAFGVWGWNDIVDSHHGVTQGVSVTQGDDPEIVASAIDYV